MAEFGRSEAYDFSLFETTAAAPQINNEPAEKPSRKNVERPADRSNKKAEEMLRRDAFTTFKHAAKVVIAALAVTLLLAAVLVSRTKLAELQKQQTKLERDLKEARSVNVSLSMQLNSSISGDKVEAYATSVLGMHKLERYQIHYFSSHDGDKAVITNGEKPSYDELADD